MSSREPGAALSDSAAAAVVLLIVVAMMTLIITAVVGAVDDVSGGQSVRTADLAPSNGTITLTGENPRNVAVEQSLNDSAALVGSGAISGDLGEDNGTLTTAEQAELVQNATAPLPSADRHSRIMYDAFGALDTIPVYIAGGSLDGSAATKVEGLAGQPAVEGDDWSVSGDTVSLIADGTLAGAPVVFAAYLAGGETAVSVALLTGGLGGMLRLAALIPLALLARRIIQTRLL